MLFTIKFYVAECKNVQLNDNSKPKSLIRMVAEFERLSLVERTAFSGRKNGFLWEFERFKVLIRFLKQNGVILVYAIFS